MTTAIWWIKRDFRLHDNDALAAALAQAKFVLPVFVFEPELIDQPDYSAMHVHAWHRALSDLRKRLTERGSNMFIATDDVLNVFSHLQQEFGFDAIFSHEETGTHWTYKRDIRVAHWCDEQQIEWREYHQNAVIRRLKNRNDRQPVFQQRLIKTPTVAAPNTVPLPQDLQGVCAAQEIPGHTDFFEAEDYSKIQFDLLQTVSETSALKELKSFLTERGIAYSGGISSPNSAFEAGSRLSPHLAWGTLSLRTVFKATTNAQLRYKSSDNDNAQQWGKSLRAFTSRLHWHDHFIQRLESESDMEFTAINPAYAEIVYENDPARLDAWVNGYTGVPMVDACMRCLQATGFMNFRMRAMVVSFAVYGLHLSWRFIHEPLARIFLDYEPGIHLSQLQMQAGVVGINTIRVYSPTKQIIDQDPDCIFIKRWIPELADFDSATIIDYEKTALGTYPKPIVDFKTNSKLMKDQIFAIRKSQQGKDASQEVLKKHGSRKKTAAKKPSSQMQLF